MQKRLWLIKLRDNRTQEDVAGEAGIARSYYTQIETGERTPSVVIAKKVAAVLGFNWTLFFESECGQQQKEASA